MLTLCALNNSSDEQRERERQRERHCSNIDLRQVEGHPDLLSTTNKCLCFLARRVRRRESHRRRGLLLRGRETLAVKVLPVGERE